MYSQDTVRIQPGYSQDTMNHHVVVVVCVVVVCVYDLPTRFMSSANSLCKQCGPRSGPTGEKVNFEKKPAYANDQQVYI